MRTTPLFLLEANKIKGKLVTAAAEHFQYLNQVRYLYILSPMAFIKVTGPISFFQDINRNLKYALSQCNVSQKLNMYLLLLKVFHRNINQQEIASQKNVGQKNTSYHRIFTLLTTCIQRSHMKKGKGLISSVHTISQFKSGSRKQEPQ